MTFILLNFMMLIDILTAVWSNFEIANMDLWRSEAYSKYFEYLDRSGGFYYEVGIFPAVFRLISLMHVFNAALG